MLCLWVGNEILRLGFKGLYQNILLTWESQCSTTVSRRKVLLVYGISEEGLVIFIGNLTYKRLGFF